jgi:PIN domain nuclease of toxin-antitoxin system
VILLDTHIWIWWVDENVRLPAQYRTYIAEHVSQGLGVSIISCWEVAKLVEYQRITLTRPVEGWIEEALCYPGMHLLDLTPRIVVESTQLPETFYRNPADQLIVATARVFDCPLVTVDTRILNYPHVETRP